MEIDPDIIDALPSPEELSQDLTNLMQYWLPRDELIREFRKFMSGMNKVDAPTNTKYKVRVMHTYMLASIITEKLSRYHSFPELQVVVNDPLDETEKVRASSWERALRAAQYEMERMGDGMVWDRVMLDAHLIDEGVERIERTPAATWPWLYQLELEGKAVPYDQRMNYKKERGWPVRATYVPLEYVYPRYDGSFPIEVFEKEPRSIHSVRNDPLFKGRAAALFDDLETKDKTRDVIILHYDTPLYHAYYAMLPGQNNQDPSSRNNREWIQHATGNLHLLYAYKHNLGRVQYNMVAGRFGGWKTVNGGIIDTAKALLHQNSVADEVASQVFTNIRATNWPTYLFKINPETRGAPTGTPPPLTVQEGMDITMYVDEELEPLVKAQENPVLPWFFDFIRSNITNLGGSPVLFGENQPGVRTGYHDALQISQAEGIDQKIEEHAAFGAIQRGTMMLLHIREIGESCWAHHVEKDQKTGRKKGNYIEVNPDELYPLPRLDARVRKPRPVDTAAAVRAAREVTDDRGGKGPLLSDETALQDYLGKSEPDVEEKLKLIESQKRAVVQKGIITDKIAEALNLMIASSGIPELNEGVVNQADPALMQAVSGVAPQSAQAGGINPHTLSQVANRNGNGAPSGLPTGMSVGQSQPEANAGQELSGLM